MCLESCSTCYQQLHSTLLRHLLRWMVGDDIEHICSTVWLSHVRNLERAVLGPWNSQILHPVAVGWVQEDTITVEDVSEGQRDVMSFLGPREVQITGGYRCRPWCDTAAVLLTPHSRWNIVLFCFFPSFALRTKKMFHFHNKPYERGSLSVSSSKCSFERESGTNLELCLLYSITWAGRPSSPLGSLKVWG